MYVKCILYQNIPSYIFESYPWQWCCTIFVFSFAWADFWAKKHESISFSAFAVLKTRIFPMWINSHSSSWWTNNEMLAYKYDIRRVRSALWLYGSWRFLWHNHPMFVQQIYTKLQIPLFLLLTAKKKTNMQQVKIGCSIVVNILGRWKS